MKNQKFNNLVAKYHLPDQKFELLSLEQPVCKKHILVLMWVKLERYTYFLTLSKFVHVAGSSF